MKCQTLPPPAEDRAGRVAALPGYISTARVTSCVPPHGCTCVSPHCCKSSESRAVPTSLSVSPAPPLTHSRHPQPPCQVPDGLLPETHGPGRRRRPTDNSAQGTAHITPACSVRSEKRFTRSLWPKEIANLSLNLSFNTLAT